MLTYAKALTIAQYQAPHDTIPTHCTSTVITLGGKSHTSAQLVALIKSVMDAEFAVSGAKAAWQRAITTAARAEATDGRTIKDARHARALVRHRSRCARPSCRTSDYAPKPPHT